jgi:hypothetical protein
LSKFLTLFIEMFSFLASLLNCDFFMNNYSLIYIRDKKFKIYFYFCTMNIFKIIMFI